jgi:hypothetical protein
VSARWQPPGYHALVRRLYLALNGEDNVRKFARRARERGLSLEDDEARRWLKAMPENHDKLVRWSRILGTTWQALVTAVEEEQLDVATMARTAKEPPPSDSRGAAPFKASGRGVHSPTLRAGGTTRRARL